MSTPDPKAILALLPNWLGDVAMATPALRALHRRFPEARISVAGRAAGVALLEGLPFITGAHVLPARPGLRQILAAAAALRAPHPELTVIFPHSFRAALLAWVVGSRRRIAQARDGRAWLLTETAPRPKEIIYTAREYLDLVAALGAQDDGAGLELHADAAHVEAVRAQVSRRPLIGIAPGAAFGPSKLWPAERFAEAVNRLVQETGGQAVMLVGPGEEEVGARVRAGAKAPILDLQSSPPSIARLKAIVAELDLLICNDTGPRHLAVAFKKPVVCIMGPTSPRYTNSPWERGRVIRIDVDCGPCQKPTCTTDHRCMTGIEVDTVVAAVLEQL
ncbi:MAG: lipopolysaccharide heptosyltransferase II [Candidatus Hydrogenedentes bacterium]|nr:lipopolysaccharide heptosyltransferase II [Candidatus Hydrogenedentota bacterium]